MTLRLWYQWFKSLALPKKWFVLFILIRPIVDNFYELKATSALASPLYIMGVLTPLFVFMSFISEGLPRRKPVPQELPFAIWAILAILNAVLFWFINISVTALGDLIKYMLPILLFFYCRRFVQSREDLTGILTTVLISCIYPMGMLLYESFVNPIGIDYLTAGRGGGSRIRGAYADIMNYAIYLILTLITVSYFFLRNLYGDRKVSLKIKSWHLVATLVLVVFGLTQIKHVSTWTVGLFTIVLLMFHNMRNIRGSLLVLGLSLIVLPFYAEDIYNSQIAPLIDKEIKVAEGDLGSEKAFNGRVTRWEKYIEIWEQMPDMNHFFGVVTTNIPEVEDMIGAGMHSDYVRNLFLTGIVGVLCYVFWMILMAAKWFELHTPEKFLLIATVSSLALWSVSTIPTLYAPYMYYIFPVFAYALLDPRKRYTH